MRNTIKNDLLELAKTIKELCSIILQEYERNHIEYVRELLQQGQQSAISMGETIESYEGEGTEAVSALEDFCEHIYQLNTIVGQKELSVTKEKRLLDKLTLRIENGIRHLPAIYEVVFFPYKAAMWDCMESIYYAAVNDADCKVFVVAIPYYDMKKNGQFGQMHYEGNLFPKEVPITAWESFNLSEHKPDIAYVHNPFDGYNIVTSIHPAYYSDKLKKYVGKLVYVPYSIFRREVPSSHQHLPIYENADYMIVQSKSLERAYKEEALKNKLLPLGSPKFDKVISYQKQGVEIPAKWKEILDGKIKILYNTSLTALLHDTDVAFQKMNYVFDCFENRENTALIWRPHPLIESTLQSMRPQYFERYQGLVKRFEESRLGVLDRTDDISKTIALSDAYIGEDASSVVDLFGITGKSMFFLNMRLDSTFYEEDSYDCQFINVEVYNGKAWTFAIKLNALCNLDMETGKLNVVASIPGYEKQCRWLVNSLYRYHEKLILSPNCIDAIVEYDIETGKFAFIKLPNALPSANLGVIISYGEDFFILPGKYPALIQYDSKQKNYIFHRQVMEDVIKQSGEIEYEDNRNCLGGGFAKGCRWYQTLTKTNAVLIWNMDSCTYEIVHVGESENTYGAIADVKNGFLLRMYEGTELLFWNPQTGETKKINKFPECFCYHLNPLNKEHPFSGFLMAQNHLLLLPMTGNQILEINRKTLEISIYEVDWKEHIREPQEGVYDNRWACFRNTLVLDRMSIINQDYSEVSCHLR